MLSLAMFWDFIKVVAIPMVGVIWVFFTKKLDKIDERMDKIEGKYEELRLIQAKSENTFVTQEQLQTLFKDLIANMEKGNNVLEERIEKLMAKEIVHIKEALNRIADKR